MSNNMKNFRQIIKQRSFICSCLLAKNRLQMPKAMPTIPEEDEGVVIYELIYRQNRDLPEMEDDDVIMTTKEDDNFDDAGSTCSSMDFTLSVSTSGDESQIEWEDWWLSIQQIQNPRW